MFSTHLAIPGSVNRFSMYTGASNKSGRTSSLKNAIAHFAAKTIKVTNVLNVKAHHMSNGVYVCATSLNNLRVSVFTHSAPLGEKRYNKIKINIKTILLYREGKVREKIHKVI